MCGPRLRKGCDMSPLELLASKTNPFSGVCTARHVWVHMKMGMCGNLCDTHRVLFHAFSNCQRSRKLQSTTYGLYWFICEIHSTSYRVGDRCHNTVFDIVPDSALHMMSGVPGVI